MNVFYLGPINTFSYQAANHLFPEKHTLLPCDSFSQIFQSVKESADSFAVIPFENSITSNVHENIDLLFKSSLKIVCELYLEIHFHLIAAAGVSLRDVKKVYSHPKAFEQCRRFCGEYHWEKIEAPSTTGASLLLDPQKNNEAAIVPASLPLAPGMQILSENIEDIEHNFTRFLVISQTDIRILEGKRNKCSVTFKVKHEEGALLSVLEVLRDNHANMTKLTSRPIPGSDWEYLFWIDFELQSEITDDILQAISKKTLEYRVVGTYPSGEHLKIA